MGTFQDLIATLPEDSNEKGLAFERLCKWLLENDPFYSSRIRKVWLWDEWHGRWGPDAGIDLVAEENDGSLWAIQSKAYAETTSVTKADVDSFLSESNREQFKFRLLIATTDAIGTTARQVIKGQEKQASLLLLNELESKPLDWPETFDDLRPTRPTRAEPRPHQSEAGFAALEAYVAETGTSRATQTYINAEGFKLGVWINTRRTDYRRGKLSEEEIKQLEAFPGWIWDGMQAQWDELFAELEAYVAETGTSRVTQKYVSDSGFPLGSRVSERVEHYRKGKLSEERILQLEALPDWTWDKSQARWDKSFAALEAYVAETGTSRVAQTYINAEGFKLGKWVTSNRRSYKKGTLSEEEIKQLEALPDWLWDASSRRSSANRSNE